MVVAVGVGMISGVGVAPTSFGSALHSLSSATMRAGDFHPHMKRYARHTKQKTQTLSGFFGCISFSVHHDGERSRIRTCDPQLRRLLLYPAELYAHMEFRPFGAGEENRTLTISLEG